MAVILFVIFLTEIVVTRIHDSNIVVVAGTVGLVGPYGFQIRDRNGQTDTVSLAKDWAVTVAVPMNRTELKRGDWVATAAVDARDPSGLNLFTSNLVGQSFTLDNKSGLASLFERTGLGNCGVDVSLGHRYFVVGEILAITGDLTLNLETRRSRVEVRIGPDAKGVRLRPGSRSDLQTGISVIASVPPSGAHQVIVIPELQ